jgi:hypothetical protein
MPPLYGIKEIMRYLQLRSVESYYKRIKLGLPACRIRGRVESSTELIEEWRNKMVRGEIKNEVSKVRRRPAAGGGDPLPPGIHPGAAVHIVRRFPRRGG